VQLDKIDYLFFTNFSKFKHSLTKKASASGGLCPWTPLGDQAPCPPFLHCKYATVALHSIGPPLNQFAGSAPATWLDLTWNKYLIPLSCCTLTGCSISPTQWWYRSDCERPATKYVHIIAHRYSQPHCQSYTAYSYMLNAFTQLHNFKFRAHLQKNLSGPSSLTIGVSRTFKLVGPKNRGAVDTKTKSRRRKRRGRRVWVGDTSPVD